MITCGLSMNHPLAAVFCSCKKGLDAFSSIFTGCLRVGRQTYLKWFEGDIQWPEARDSTAGVGWHRFMIWCIPIIDSIGYAICGVRRLKLIQQKWWFVEGKQLTLGFNFWETTNISHDDCLPRSPFKKWFTNANRSSSTIQYHRSLTELNKKLGPWG